MKMNIHIWFNKCQLLIYMSVSKKSQNLFNCAWHNLAPNSQLSFYSLHYFQVKNLLENENIAIATKISILLYPSANLLPIKNHLWLYTHREFYLALIFHILFSLSMSAYKITHCMPLEVYQLSLQEFPFDSLPRSHLLYFQANSSFILVVIFKDLSVLKDCSIKLKYYIGWFCGGLEGFFVFLFVWT